MADRPSKKERRELARQAHAAASRRARGRAIRRRITRTVVVIVAIVGVTYYFVTQSQANKNRIKRLNALGTELNCSGSINAADPTSLTEFPSLGATHVPEGDITYPRMPPESGNHRPFWAKTGIHTEPIESTVQVHNLEHGHVVLQYRPGTAQDIIDGLNRVAKSNESWIISAPYEEFMDPKTTVSMTAWQYRLDCPDLDAADADKLEELARKFVEARRDKAPEESVPGEPNRPEEDEESPEPTPETTETPTGTSAPEPTSS